MSVEVLTLQVYRVRCDVCTRQTHATYGELGYHRSEETALDCAAQEGFLLAKDAVLFRDRRCTILYPRCALEYTRLQSGVPEEEVSK